MRPCGGYAVSGRCSGAAGSGASPASRARATRSTTYSLMLSYPAASAPSTMTVSIASGKRIVRVCRAPLEGRPPLFAVPRAYAMPDILAGSNQKRLHPGLRRRVAHFVPSLADGRLCATIEAVTGVTYAIPVMLDDECVEGAAEAGARGGPLVGC